MTIKEKILNNIRNVKSEHVKWLTYAEAKIQGINISENLVPVSYKDCACGKTFLQNGQIIYHIKSAQSIPADHEEFHKLYEKLYDLMNNKTKGNFLTKNAIQKKHDRAVNNYFNILKKLSDNIINSFDLVYKEVELITNEELMKNMG